MGARGHTQEVSAQALCTAAADQTMPLSLLRLGVCICLWLPLSHGHSGEGHGDSGSSMSGSMSGSDDEPPGLFTVEGSPNPKSSTFYFLHGLCMLLAWGLLAPTGVIISRFYKAW